MCWIKIKIKNQIHSILFSLYCINIGTVDTHTNGSNGSMNITALLVKRLLAKWTSKKSSLDNYSLFYCLYLIHSANIRPVQCEYNNVISTPCYICAWFFKVFVKCKLSWLTAIHCNVSVFGMCVCGSMIIHLGFAQWNVVKPFFIVPKFTNNEEFFSPQSLSLELSFLNEWISEKNIRLQMIENLFTPMFLIDPNHF